MKKLFNLILIAILGVMSVATVSAKPMPSDAIPTTVKIQFNNGPVQEANGFIVDGYTYVRGRDLAEICGFMFVYDSNRKEVVTSNSSEISYFSQERLDDEIGAYQYNNENYLQIRKIMWYALFRPQISYDNSTKVISLIEEITLGREKNPTTQEEYTASTYDYNSQNSSSSITPSNVNTSEASNNSSSITPPKADSVKPITEQEIIKDSNNNSVSNVNNNVIENIDTSKYIKVGGTEVRLGDSLDMVKAKFGEPDRIGVSRYNFDWYFYNTTDYTDFVMVGIKDDTVVGLYSNAKSFESSMGDYGDNTSETYVGISKILKDQNNNDKVYGVCIVSDSVKNRETLGSDFFDDYSKEIFDCTNGFRVANGRTVLKEDKAATVAILNHCKDMAENDYFSHQGLNGSTLSTRYKDAGGEKAYYIGENLTAGSSTGIWATDAWVNSKGHRENMLLEKYTHFGVGVASNPKSTYNYYAGQLFIEK